MTTVGRRHPDGLLLGPQLAWMQGPAAGDRGVDGPHETGVERIAGGVVDDELRRVPQILEKRKVGPRRGSTKPSRTQKSLGIKPADGQAVENLARGIHHLRKI